jgi:hypothetical protein
MMNFSGKEIEIRILVGNILGQYCSMNGKIRANLDLTLIKYRCTGNTSTPLHMC